MSDNKDFPVPNGEGMHSTEKDRAEGLETAERIIKKHQMTDEDKAVDEAKNIFKEAQRHSTPQIEIQPVTDGLGYRKYEVTNEDGSKTLYSDRPIGEDYSDHH